MSSGHKLKSISIIGLLALLIAGALCPFSVFGRELRYHEYLQIWQDRKRPEQELVVPAWALLKEGETMEWTVEVPEEGLYNLTLVYLPVQGRGARMELELTLKVNGPSPKLATCSSTVLAIKIPSCGTAWAMRSGLHRRSSRPLEGSP